MNPLKPVMAAALAAFCAMSALPSSASAEGPAVPKTAPAQVKEETNAVNILTELITKDKKAQADVSARVQRLLLNPDSKGRSYVTADLPKDPLAKTIPELVSTWVEKHPAEAARLYYVARPLGGKVPEWVTKHPKGGAIFQDDEKSKTRPERLSNYLAGADQRNVAGSQIGVVAVSGLANSLAQFLDEAAKGAGVVLDPGVPATPEEARREAERHDSPIDVPANRPGGGAIGGTASGFSFKDLYEEGAMVVDISGPKDDGSYRTLSIKMYTVPDGKGHFENKIGIVDITDPKSPYGPQMIALSHGETTFDLKSGGRKYSLSIDDKDVIAIKRPEGVATEISVADLAKKRLDQVAGRGSVDIGGKQYYVVGQGGIKGSLVFFSKEQVDARKPPYDAEAVASADVSEVAAGRTRPIEGKPDLGKIDGKPYHLEFQKFPNGDGGVWKVAKGPGDQPPAPPKESGAGKPGQEPGKPGGGAAGGPKTLAEVVELYKQNGFEEPEPDGNEGFSDEMREVAHILVNPKTAPHACFFLAPGINDGNQLCAGKLAGEKLIRLRGFGDYGVVEYSTTKQYYSRDSFAVKQPAGTYGKNGMTDVTDVDLAIDMLSAYAKMPADRLKIIQARLNKHTEGAYRISGNAKMVAIYNETEDKTCPIWPAEGRCGSGDNTGMEEAKGPGTVVELSFGEDAEFIEKLPVDATQNMIRQKVSEDGGTALYLLDDAAAGEKRWFVMVRAVVNGAPSRSRHVQIFGTGKDWNALPDGYSLQGYASAEVPRGAKLGLVIGSAGEQGAMCLYRHSIPAKDGSNVKDKKGNSVGPVLTWGGGDAVKACRAGAF